MRRLALSPSRAGDFKRCPLLYRLRAIDRVPEKPSVAQVTGNVVHAVLEELYGRPRADRGVDAALELLEPAWVRHRDADAAVAALVPDADLSAFLDDARSLLRRYYTMEDPTRFEPHACEQYVDADLDGTPVRGFIDRVDIAPTGEVRVVDYKTGRMPSPRFREEALFQMRFYGLVYLRTRGVLPTQLKLMYLKEGDSIIHAPSVAELESFERSLHALWKAIRAAGETGDFRPRKSRLCDWCDHQARCPEFGGTPPEYPGWPG